MPRLCAGQGIWPRSARRPEPFRPEEAKVFLDLDCLHDGQNWLAGFVQGLVASMAFVPILSWTEDDQGSLGELSKIGVDGFDRVDNVLLEMVLATALREEPRAACQVSECPYMYTYMYMDTYMQVSQFPYLYMYIYVCVYVVPEQMLLEMVLVTALREEPRAACQVVLPVMVGAAVEGGGFSSS